MLKQRIQKDAAEALKGGNDLAAQALRMVLASVISKEKEKRYRISKSRFDNRGSSTESGQKPEFKEEDLVKESFLTDEEIIDVISFEIKKRKDAIVLYEKGNRQELADKEKKETAILQKYLPEQLSAEDIKKLAAEAVEKTGAREMKDMGRVMADLTTKIKNRADSGEVSKIVKELLSKGTD